jgi:H/ACA ribonucleoprotein complex subunit 4
MLVLRKEPYATGKAPSERTMEERLRFGVVPVDKPPGPTSHEVAAFAKRILGVNKTGHTGTLDATVSGVLPILLNESCKASKAIMGGKKKYVCVMRLPKEIPRLEIEEALSHFRGKIWQKPPLASAVAKKLRIREVFSLNLLEVDGRLVLFDAETEAGTYIRNIVRDVGEVLGTGAEMAELRRTLSGGFTEGECVTLQELSDRHWLWKEKGEEKPLRECVHQIEDVVGFKRVVTADDAIHSITTGANLAVPGINQLDESIAKGEIVGIFSGKGELLCIAEALMGAEEIKGREKGIAFDVMRVIHGY